MKKLLMLGLLFISSPAMAASIGPCSSGWFSHDICITGDIVPGDAKIFHDISPYYQNGTAVFLNSRGGNVSEMLDMGDIIHQRHFTTAINNRGVCASACAVLFLSGFHAVIERNSRLIYHEASDGNGTPADNEANQWIASRVVRWGGVTYNQIWFLLHSAPPEGGMLSTEWLARQLGFRFSYVADRFNLWRSCQTKFCVAL